MRRLFTSDINTQATSRHLSFSEIWEGRPCRGRCGGFTPQPSWEQVWPLEVPGACVPVEDTAVGGSQPSGGGSKCLRKSDKVVCGEPLAPSPLPARCKAKEGRGRSGEWGKLRPVSEGSAQCHQTTLRAVEGSAGALAPASPRSFSPRGAQAGRWDFTCGTRGGGLGQAQSGSQFFLGLLPPHVVGISETVRVKRGGTGA